MTNRSPSDKVVRAQSLVRASIVRIKIWCTTSWATHTYLDGSIPFKYLGSLASRALHSTATLSSEGARGLYVLRCMHRLNIFLSCFGHSGWAGSLFLFFCTCLTLTPCVFFHWLHSVTYSSLSYSNTIFIEIVYVLAPRSLNLRSSQDSNPIQNANEI
jgi:hypothetical protein